MAKKLPAPLPRVALTPAEAAAAIGVGPDFFDQRRGCRDASTGDFLDLGNRQPELDAGADLDLAGDPHRAAGLRHQAIDHRQAEPGAASRALVVKNGSVARFSVTSSMPLPVSRSVIQT